jgi:hypothetical protein
VINLSNSSANNIKKKEKTQQSLFFFTFVILIQHNTISRFNSFFAIPSLSLKPIKPSIKQEIYPHELQPNSYSSVYCEKWNLCIRNWNFSFSCIFSATKHSLNQKPLTYPYKTYIQMGFLSKSKRRKLSTQNSNLPFHFLFLAFSTKPKGAIRNEE